MRLLTAAFAPLNPIEKNPFSLGRFEILKRPLSHRPDIRFSKFVSSKSRVSV
jgi:hypothetical protein